MHLTVSFAWLKSAGEIRGPFELCEVNNRCGSFVSDASVNNSTCLTLLVSQLELFALITNAIKNYHELGPDKRTRGALESRLEGLETNWRKLGKK